MDPSSHTAIGICSEASRWVLGISVLIGLLVLAVSLWTLAIYREAARRLTIAQRIEPAPPPTWRSKREIVARGTSPVGPGEEVVDLRFTGRDATPVPPTPRSGTSAPSPRSPGP